MSTADPVEQRRKLALLEARLSNSTTTPVTPAAPPIPTAAVPTTPTTATTTRPQPPPPISIGSLSGSAFESSDDSAVLSDQPTAPSTRPPNPRRNHAPPTAPPPPAPVPPRHSSKGAAPAPRTRPPNSTPTAPRKRRRTTSSPNQMRNSRVDAYFKPRSRDSSKDCVPLAARARPTSNAPATAAAAAAVLSAALGTEQVRCTSDGEGGTAMPIESPSPNGEVSRALALRSPSSGDDIGECSARMPSVNPKEYERTPPSASFPLAMGEHDEDALPPPDGSDGDTGNDGVQSGLGNADDYRHMRAMIERLKDENQRIKPLEEQLKKLEAENEDLSSQLEVELPILREQASAAAADREKAAEQISQMRLALRNTVVALANMERSEARRKIAVMSERVGRLGVERTRTSFQEVWEDGNEWREMIRKLKDIQTERESIDRKRRDMAKAKTSKQKQETKRALNSGSDGDDPMKDVKVAFEHTSAYHAEQEEIYKVQLQALKREEQQLVELRSRLERERDVHLREIRRQADEDISAFNKFQTLNGRYVALNLLGRGGFSEVFKGFDLDRGCYVACKIHQLASNWNENKKRSFIRHSMREYEIHKSLRHPRVVQLIDIFEIDENTFCTVLEFCDGSDLDSYLRQHHTLPEREARSIIAQVVSGLVYLSEQRKRIIHYDLKPGNILFHHGEVRIADFGLSKIMNEGDSTQMGMELTSQGAGTMWYLPPECFETTKRARISSKVDVWSAGVILYQMLYGRKPFGHDQTQEKMFREKTVSHQDLKFPAKPVVSDVAKLFMAACLTRDAATRPSVQELVGHPFFKKK